MGFVKKYFLAFYLVSGTLLFGFISWTIEGEVSPYADRQVSGYVSPPRIDVQGQLFSLSSIDDNAKIFYSIDGSSPVNEDAQYYTSACDLSLEKSSNQILRIRTSHRYKSPLSWELPFKAKIVRYVQQMKHLGYSKPRMTTVFSKRLNSQLKILSIAVDNKDLFDPIEGKMMLGRKSWNRERRGISEPWWAQEANYREKGYKSSVYAGIEWIDEDGKTIEQDNVKLRIHGNASRSFAQKSLKLEGESYYGSGSLSDIFDFIKHDSLKSMMLRNSGNDWGKSMFQDAYIQSISDEIGIPSLRSEPIHVLINGVYWGIYNARPRFDETYLAQYGKKSGRFALIELDSELDEGKQKDLEDYLSIKMMIESPKITLDEKLKVLESKIDVQNFIDYIIVETFFSNGDWNPNNIKTFRLSKKAPWRWAIHDMDYGMTYAGLDEGIHANLFLKLKDQNNVTSSVFNLLMLSESHKNQFIARANALLKSALSSQKLNVQLSAFKRRYEGDIKYQIARWQKPGSLSDWTKVVSDFKTFNLARQKVYLTQLKSL